MTIMQIGQSISRKAAAARWLLPVTALLLLFAWLMYTPSGLLGKADAVGYAVCHRIEVRSFIIGERAMPLCARCSGMYLGAVLGLVFQSLIGWRRSAPPPWKIILPLGLFVAAFGLDGGNSYLHLWPNAPTLYEPQNWLRLLTGTGMGLALSAAVFPAFNQTFFYAADPRPALDSWRSFAGLLLLAAVLDLAVLSEITAILYPLALISAAGVLLLLVIVYSVLWATIFRQENRNANLSQLWQPLTAGFILALLQIGLLDLARFWLTGTWSGFSFG